MTTAEDNAFQEALTALHNGEKSRARDLLTRLIKTNPNNPQYWLWMSAVVETSRELTFCLKETLKRDPQNITARRGLILQGELPPDPSLAVPAHLQRRNWQAQYFSGQTVPGQLPKRSWWRLGLTVGGVLVLIVLAVIAIAGLTHQDVPAFITWLQRYTPQPTSNITLAATSTANTTTPTLQKTLSTPQITMLAASATPLYVNTPHPITESYRSAVGAFKRGDWTGTITFLQQAIREDSRPDLYYLLGEANRFLKKSKEALQAYEQAIQMDPRFAPPYLGRARLRLATNPALVDAVIADMEKAISLDGNYAEAYLELAALKIEQNDASSALRDLDNAARLLPDSSAPDTLRVRAYIALNQPDQALTIAQRVNQANPNALDSYRLLAEAYRARDDLAGSITPLEIYTRNTTGDAEALAWLGQAYAARGDTNLAITTLDKAVGENAQSYQARVLRAFVFIDLKDAKSALDDLRQADALQPNNYQVAFGLGRVALLNGDSSEAWRQFSAALRLAEANPEKAQAYYWRAIALETGKQATAAIADWVELLRLPAGSLPAAQQVIAQQHLQDLLSTATPPTRTPINTLTLSPTILPSPSRTPAISATATVTPTPTVVATPSS